MYSELCPLCALGGFIAWSMCMVLVLSWGACWPFVILCKDDVETMDGAVHLAKADGAWARARTGPGPWALAH